MIRKISSKIFTCLVGTILSVSALNAQEGTKERERVPVKTRPTQVVECTTEESTSEEQVTNHNLYYTSHPGAFHRVSAVSLMGDTIELEDGSIWSVYSGDSYKTSNWLPGDLVVLTINKRWFSSYDFRMTNQNTGVSVLINLSFGPFYDSPMSHWIVAIDYDYNIVYLEDGSVWNMSYFDYGTVRKWLPDDTVIIGINDEIFSYQKPNFLLNVNTLTSGTGIANH